MFLAGQWYSGGHRFQLRPPEIIAKTIDPSLSSVVCQLMENKKVCLIFEKGFKRVSQVYQLAL